MAPQVPGNDRARRLWFIQRPSTSFSYTAILQAPGYERREICGKYRNEFGPHALRWRTIRRRIDSRNTPSFLGTCFLPAFPSWARARRVGSRDPRGAPPLLHDFVGFCVGQPPTPLGGFDDSLPASRTQFPFRLFGPSPRARRLRAPRGIASWQRAHPFRRCRRPASCRPRYEKSSCYFRRPGRRGRALTPLWLRQKAIGRP